MLAVAATLVACTQTRLTAMLGYESAAVCALMFGGIGPALGLSARAHEPNAKSAIAYALRFVAYMVAGSFVVVWATGQVLGPCNDAIGASFFALLVVPSALYGTLLGCALGQWPALLKRRAWRITASLFVPIAFAVSALFRLYTEPPIRLFSFLFGYFAGSIYDEQIDLLPALFAFRGLTLVLSVATLWFALASPPSPYGSRRARLCICLALHLAANAAGPVIGTRLTSQQLRNVVLPLALERPGIIVHLPADVPLSLAERIADDHAFRWQSLADRIPQAASLGPVHSHVFRSQDDIARWLGLRGTQITRPWRREIYVHGLMPPHPLLAHELAHVALAAVARPPLHVAATAGLWPHMPMVEGMAVALAPDVTSLGLIETACHLRSLHLGVPLHQLLHSNPLVATRAFWSESPERAYTLAGAFFVDLQARFGLAPLLNAYKDADLSRALQSSMSQLEQEFWQRHERPMPAHEREWVRGDMRRDSVFVRHCPHEVAAMRAIPRPMALGDRLLWAQRLRRISGNAPEATLDLLRTLREAKDTSAVRALEAQYLLQAPRDAVERAMRLLYQAEVAIDAHDEQSARALYEEGMALPLGVYDHAHFVIARHLLGAPQNMQEMVRRASSLGASTTDIEKAWQCVSTSDDPALGSIGHYKLAERAAARFDAQAACQHLQSAEALPDASLQRQRLRMLVTQAWLNHDLALSMDALNAATKHERTSADTRWEQDWRARYAFDSIKR